MKEYAFNARLCRLLSTTGLLFNTGIEEIGMNKSVLGWKWFSFITKVKIPIIVLVFVVLSIVLTMQVFTNFAIDTLFLDMFCIYILVVSILIWHGFKYKKKYAIYLYIIVSVSMIAMNIYFKLSLINFFASIVILFLEIWYFAKRIKYFI